MVDDPNVPDSTTPETAAPAARTRRRAASRPAGPPSSVAPSAEVPPAVSEETAKPPPRKRASKKATTAADAPAAEVAPPAAAAPAEAVAEPVTKPKRTRKKATSAVFSADEEPAAPVEATVVAAEAAAVVLFQPPDPEQAEAPRRRRSRTRVEEPVADGATVVAEDTTTETATEDVDAGELGAEDEDESTGTPRRRRRRGGRGRRGRGGRDGETPEVDTNGSEGTEGTEAPAATEDESEVGGDDEGAGGSTSSRRRRRRRRGGAGDADGGGDDPPNTVVRVREPRGRTSDEVTGVRGSTRLEAKKQRRREGREQGRRRPPILTESEFLARRESVDRVMIVRQTGDRTQIAVLEDGMLAEHYVNKAESTSFVGNVYLGRVQNVLPSMEAAFVDIGKGRNAVLYAGEVNWDAAGLDGQPRRIEHAMKSGDQVLVQVTKDPIGHKGSRLTAQISLPGRFLVYVPDGSMTGISRKLPDTERTRLKAILKSSVPEGAGVIVRTAAEGASEEELSRDVARLTAQWEDVEKKSKAASAPALLYGEPDLAVRVLRDVFNEDVNKLIVSGDDAWDMVQPYLAHVAPDLVDRLTRWTDEQDVFAAHRIDEQLAKALDRKVWLPSGGSLVIDRTEAMTVVDVNTGKFIGAGGNLEETVTRNNLEAAEEIVRQLRLRDVGGIIVVDFIDMVLESNRDLVLRRLLECLSRDRTKHQVAEVTSLGLVQMTRKRVGQGLIEAFSEPCEHCSGRGVKVQMEPVDLKTTGGSTPDQPARRKRGGKAKADAEAPG
ncbi:MAG TPA: Rne/Rng family ribonuclease [Candidatus Limnocylindria bacterium]|nr:Rne/Rng family ribonuclease [Candidatus Limnocylindria bacterium]